ncbi:sensor histidine kinase [Nitrospira moscoviensis]|uniref:histidine kinase n=1 Tax=Nitrospira moscoviensis TaxID=42253 RepID=A0A0K2GJ87_NITMO|nr:sensor histidine kinase [Nitrospira moscoviensis]ALA60914.1 putative Histidine kinase [Nitrospira moscoviensis]
MTATTNPSGRSRSGRPASILFKVGLVVGALSLAFGVLLLITSHLTRQLIGTSKAIEQAGAERMRVYKLAALIQRLPGSDTGREAERIRADIVELERVLEGLRFGTIEHGAVADISPALSTRMQKVQDRWSIQLRPALEQALGATGERLAALQREYLALTDEFVTDMDALVQSVEQESAGRVQSLYSLQIGFLLASLSLAALALMFLHRAIREPLKRLTEGAEHMAAGELHTKIQVHGHDELGQLARTFERMAETIQTHIEEMKALHATGEEIGMLEPGGLEGVLRRIADRATESLDADVALVMVRHLTMECWVVEAASGTAFDHIREQIMLFEETPFSNQAYETKRPVVVTDLAQYADRPIRFRDQFGAKSYMAVPLVGPHECRGVLVLLSITRMRTFTEWDIQLAQQFASYAAVTMENARLFETVESESETLRAKLRAVERNVAELMHEVKAPAGRVAEFASWLEQDYARRLDEKGLRYLAWIKNEGRDLAALAGRTLDLARINHEPSPLESVDVDSVVREVITALQADRDKRGVRITIQPGLPRLACRRIHLKQVFDNLIGNAIKYMGDQPVPEVDIGTQDSDRGLLLYVRDNGMGIDPAMRDRIFLPFSRLVTEEIPGSGIGLSIVKTVVEQYEGEVTVESSPGKGSTFFVRLPVLSAPAGQTELHGDAVAGAAPGLKRRGA